MFRHVGIVVNNLEKAKEFYSKYFNLQVCREKTLQGKYIETILDCKDVVLTYVKMHKVYDGTPIGQPIFELIKYHDTVFQSSFKTRNHVAFTVTNIFDLYLEMINDKIRVYSRPTKASDSGAYVFFCEDYEGNLIEVVED